MGLSLTQIRNTLLLTSIHGRRLGLDTAGYVCGPAGLRDSIEDITTTAATSALPHGLTRVLTSGSSQTGLHTLMTPAIGIQKHLALTSTSTGTHQFTPSNATLFSSAGTSVPCVSLLGGGAFITLFADTTASWRVVSSVGSIGFTTST